VPTLVAAPPEKRPTEDLMADAERLGALAASVFGQLLPILGELDRRQAFRSEGATSMATWTTERCGVSTATARMWTTVAQALWDLPQIADALQNGTISLDKARAAAKLATPETDADVLAQARQCSVHQLTELSKNRHRPTDDDADAEHEARYLRFNDERRTITAQLPPSQYAQARSIIEGAARDFPSDGLTRWDQRLADGLLQILGTPAPGSDATADASSGGRTSHFLVVAHTDLAYLQGGEGSAEIERLGLLSRETIRRISCDADVILAVDDDVGHTMFEGRRHRYPTPTQRREVKRRDRHCRFPGCSNALFTDVHHVVHWTPSGLTDLPNLALLCSHHHDRVHSGGWSVSGDANVELTFVGPSGRPMSSRPSPLWTKTDTS
jgi:hypothetical protein